MWKIEKIISKGDYNYAKVLEHPNSNIYGYVLEHRIIMENHLGRLLNSNEVVHHLNENKKDNRIENLKLMKVGEHERLHGLQHGKKMIELKCPNCGNNFIIARNQSFLIKKNKLNCSFCSPHCRGVFSRNYKLYGITHEMKLAISVNIVREFVDFHDNTEQTVK